MWRHKPCILGRFLNVGNFRNIPLIYDSMIVLNLLSAENMTERAQQDD